MNAHLFIAEDEPELSDLIRDYARAGGYRVTQFDNGAHALAALRTAPPDLLVLDLMLPGLDGLAVCRALRLFSDLPVIMVTARVEEIDRLCGLDAGADDYVCKPFSPRELMARIKAILRRMRLSQADHPNPAVVPYRVDETARRILVQGVAIDLTPTEYRLFSTLLNRPEQIFSRARLLDAIAPDDLDITERAIDSHVKNLRRKITNILPDADPIQSVYGVGYRLVLPPEFPA